MTGKEKSYITQESFIFCKNLNGYPAKCRDRPHYGKLIPSRDFHDVLDVAH